MAPAGARAVTINYPEVTPDGSSSWARLPLILAGDEATLEARQATAVVEVMTQYRSGAALSFRNGGLSARPRSLPLFVDFSRCDQRLGLQVA